MIKKGADKPDENNIVALDNFNSNINIFQERYQTMADKVDYGKVQMTKSHS